MVKSRGTCFFFEVEGRERKQQVHQQQQQQQRQIDCLCTCRRLFAWASVCIFNGRVGSDNSEYWLTKWESGQGGRREAFQ